jgi:hypothetical protein
MTDETKTTTRLEMQEVESITEHELTDHHICRAKRYIPFAQFCKGHNQLIEPLTFFSDNGCHFKKEDVERIQEALHKIAERGVLDCEIREGVAICTVYKRCEREIEEIELVIEELVELDEQAYHERRDAVRYDSALETTKMTESLCVNEWLAKYDQKLSPDNVRLLTETFETHRDCRIHLDLDRDVLYVDIYKVSN